MDRLIFRCEGRDHPIEVTGEHAPETLAKVRAILPQKVDVHCAKIAGSHIMWPVPFVQRTEGAKDVLSMPPGAFFFWPERQYLEITYAELQAESAAVSYLGKLEGDVSWLADYADRQRRGQGRAVFTAELLGGDSAPAAPPAPPPASPRLAAIRAARLAAWEAEPAEIAGLLGRRGKMIPFGPLHMAEGEMRKLHELLWRLWTAADTRPASETAAIARFVLEAGITRVGGLCHLTGASAVLAEGIACIEESADPLPDILEELVLYAGRIAAWLDLHIPFHDCNETLRAALAARPS